MTSAADREERSFLHNFLSQGEREYKDTAYEQARPPIARAHSLAQSSHNRERKERIWRRNGSRQTMKTYGADGLKHIMICNEQQKGKMLKRQQLQQEEFRLLCRRSTAMEIEAFFLCARVTLLLSHVVGEPWAWVRKDRERETFGEREEIPHRDREVIDDLYDIVRAHHRAPPMKRSFSTVQPQRNKNQQKRE